MEKRRNEDSEGIEDSTDPTLQAILDKLPPVWRKKPEAALPPRDELFGFLSAWLTSLGRRIDCVSRSLWKIDPDGFLLHAKLCRTERPLWSLDTGIIWELERVEKYAIILLHMGGTKGWVLFDHDVQRMTRGRRKREPPFYRISRKSLGISGQFHSGEMLTNLLGSHFHFV